LLHILNSLELTYNTIIVLNVITVILMQGIIHIVQFYAKVILRRVIIVVIIILMLFCAICIRYGIT